MIKVGGYVAGCNRTSDQNARLTSTPGNQTYRLCCSPATKRHKKRKSWVRCVPVSENLTIAALTVHLSGPGETTFDGFAFMAHLPL